MSDILQRLFSLSGKTALITGASGGIGRALSIAFAEAGAAVGLHGTNTANLTETLRLVEEAGGQGIVLTADLQSVDACRQLIDDANEKLGRIDVLINNAGMNRRMPLEEFSQDDFDTIVSVNLRSPFFLANFVHPIMKAQGGGKIVNIGSLTTLTAVGNVGVYGMTKSALGQLTKTQAVEWAKHNIQVNCIAPGFIRTPLTATAQWADPVRRKWILERVPARRPGLPEDLIGAALLLATSAGDFITGQTLAVDGGYLAGGSWTPDEHPVE